jgi:hypothetical protein
MYKVTIKPVDSDEEVVFTTREAMNRQSAVIQARRAYPDSVVISVLPA